MVQGAAAIFPEGPIRNTASIIGVIIGAIAILKFFFVFIGPNEGGYRHRGDRLLEAKSYWVLSCWSGVMFMKCEPYHRFYGRGIHMQIPFLYAITKMNVADETRPIEPFEVTIESLGRQHTAKPQVTYRIKRSAPAMYLAKEKALNLDATVVSLVRAAAFESLRLARREDFSGNISDYVTLKSSSALRQKLDEYGVELVRIELTESDSFGQMVSGGTVPVGAVIQDPESSGSSGLHLVP